MVETLREAIYAYFCKKVMEKPNVFTMFFRDSRSLQKSRFRTPNIHPNQTLPLAPLGRGHSQA